MVKQRVGNTKLRDARNASGKTQAQIAREVGVTARAYQYYESGERIPGVNTALSIARALGCSVEDLF